MAFWQMVLIQGLVAGLVVLGVLTGVYLWVFRPYLDRKVRELTDAAADIESRVTAGVRRGVSESLRELPETAARESTRPFLKFGSELIENGLSSLLGSSADMARRSGGTTPESEPTSTRSTDRR